jgi:nitric oxide reductase NorQ protein
MATEELTEETPEYRQYAVEEYHPHKEPYYVPTGDEVELFMAAFESKVPVLLKGPTGCGKTRFVEYMAWKLGRPLSVVKGGKNGGQERTEALPLVTVACHEDLTASDLVGRYLLEGEGTRWIDGPLTRAVKAGAICYLDEVVEARKDTTVLIHPLTDHRRILPI